MVYVGEWKLTQNEIIVLIHLFVLWLRNFCSAIRNWMRETIENYDAACFRATRTEYVKILFRIAMPLEKGIYVESRFNLSFPNFNSELIVNGNIA